MAGMPASDELAPVSDAALAADLRALAGSLDFGMAQVDAATGRFLWVNDAMRRILGRSREVLLASTSSTFLHPDDIPARERLYAGVAAHGSAAEEARFLRDDGSEVWIRVHSAAVHDADGEVRRTINLFYDLTERRAAEAQIRDNNERTSLALRFADAGTWEYVIGTGEMIWSPETFALYGLSPSGPAPRRREWTKHVHPEDVDRINAEHSNALTGGSIGSDFRIRRKDGGWRWVGTRAQVIFDHDGQPQRVVGINIDLTGSKAAEAERAAAAARWQAAVEATEGVVWTNDAEGRMTGEQPGWAGLTGQSREAYQGYGWASAVHPDDAQPSIDAWEQAVAARAPFHFEHRVRRADGEWRRFTVRAIPVFGADGEIVEWVGVHNDVTEAREAERLLAERVAQAIADRDQAWNNSRDLMAIIGADGCLAAANPAWTAALGWTTEELIGRSHLTLNHPDDQISSDAVLAESRRSAIPSYECRVVHKDGSYRSVSWVLASPDGETTFINGRDVTGEREQRAELARAMAERDSAWNNARDVLLILNPGGVITAANPAWTETLGWAVQEAIGHHYSDFVASDVAEVKPGQPVRLDGRQLPYFENDYRHKDGGARTMSWRTQIEGGLIYCNGRDVSEDKQRQAELAKVREERDRGWNNARDILLVLGADGIVSAANPAWTATLGWPVEDIVGRRYSDFIVQDDLTASDGALATATRTALPGFENHYRHKDGSIRTISWTAQPAGGEVFASGRDVTEERRRQAELERAQAQVHEMQKLETIGQLTGGVAHDFNNLLTPIIGSLDMIQRRLSGSDERISRLIDGALTAADRAKTLVQRLLAFARRQQLQTRAVDPIALVEGMRELIDRSLGPSIAVTIVHEDMLPAVQADPGQLELALLNLAINARDAMPGGGRLTIAMTRGDASGRGQLEKGDYVRLAVVDTGEGMDATTLRRAIEPFFSTKGVGRGTGLGLSMVHGLAAQFGGRLTLASAPGHGTRAELWLPVAAEAAAAEPTAEAPPPPAPQRRERVLLVDDEQLVREATTEMLADLGLDVTPVDGPQAALALLDAGEAYDAMVTDYLMPGMNGGELIAAARTRQPGLPALVVTGYADAGTLPAALPRLAKPFRQAELTKAVAALLEGR